MAEFRSRARLAAEADRRLAAANRPVTDWDPFQLGVHRPVDPIPGTPVVRDLPEYVERAHDAQVRDLLKRAEHGPVVAVLVGGSWAPLRCPIGGRGDLSDRRWFRSLGRVG